MTKAQLTDKIYKTTFAQYKMEDFQSMAIVGNARMDASRQADENCLKAILMIHIDKGRAYVSDLAEALGVALTTAYYSAYRLADAGYIQPLERRGGRKSNKQTLVLTPEGEKLASQILEKHQQIQRWLTCLGVPKEEADEEACHWEHSITDKTMEAIQHHVEMAARIRGGDANAVDVMNAMARAFGQGNNQTISGNLISIIDQYGGAEGIRRKGELSARAGGDDQLEETLVFLEESGGIDKVRADLLSFSRLKKMTDRNGGEDGMAALFALCEDLGGVRRLNKLKTLADAMGGIDQVLRILGQNYKLWSAALQADHDET